MYSMLTCVLCGRLVLGYYGGAEHNCVPPSDRDLLYTHCTVTKIPASVHF
jgi:hypothetical protein